MKMRWLITVGLIAVSFVAAWSFYERRPAAMPLLFGHPQAASRPLAQVTPEGALLYIEAQDFSGLLNDWNNAPEKARWLASENNRVFPESRMVLRLKRFYEEFAVAAGAPPDTRFVADAAGKESVFALYDIGRIEFLYVTHLPSTSFLNSVLWQSRNKFQPRSAGGAPFFARKDEGSGQVVTFAIAGDYLLLATREDLMAHALQLLGGQPSRSLQQEEWFSKAVAEAPVTKGDLRMALNLERIAVAPQFRTYWIQQNITEMQGYTSAVSDLYRQGSVYREERVLLRKAQEGTGEKTGDQSESPAQVDALLPLLSSNFSDSGFYQLKTGTPQEAADVLEQKILSPHVTGVRNQSLAPQVVLTNGEVGSDSDLDIRIDDTRTDDTRMGDTRIEDMRMGGARIDVAAPAWKENSSPALRRQFDQADARAFVVVQGACRNQDNVLLTIPAVMVIAASHDWNLEAVQAALQADLASSLSASTLGLGWRQQEQAAGEAGRQAQAGGQAQVGRQAQGGASFELDGLHPLQLAVRGKLLYISNQPEMLAAMLHAKNDVIQPHADLPGIRKGKIDMANSNCGTAAPGCGAIVYMAGFSHAQERQGFYELVAALDRSEQATSAYESNQPRFFSQNIASLSRTLARLESEKVVVREAKNKVFQTVIYRWAE